MNLWCTLMYLSSIEEKMLNGEYGEAVELAIRIIVKVGESLGADRLVKVNHVHISGVSYSNIGDPGLRLIEKLAEIGGSFRVFTTVNPTCIDLFGKTSIFSKDLITGQMRIINALERMGAKPTYTCIPYFIRKPIPNEHLAWGESNAVAMANSYYGARTNREGGPLTIASALTGRTYYAGLHILENRAVKYGIKIEHNIVDEADASILGLYIGDKIHGIPLVENVEAWNFYMIKEFLASAAATGNHALIVLNNITPRNTYIAEDHIENILIDRREIMDFYNKYSSTPDISGKTLVYIGCPHLSVEELKYMVDMISKYKSVKENVVFLITVPYNFISEVQQYTGILRSKGIYIAYGTCPIVSKFKEKPDKVLTNSGKALFYLSKLHGLEVSLLGFKDIIRRVMTK